MDSQTDDNRERIDRKTSRSICDAVAERLQQSLRPEPLSSHLEHLTDELRRRDDSSLTNEAETCGARPRARSCFA